MCGIAVGGLGNGHPQIANSFLGSLMPHQPGTREFCRRCCLAGSDLVLSHRLLLLAGTTGMHMRGGCGMAPGNQGCRGLYSTA